MSHLRRPLLALLACASLALSPARALAQASAADKETARALLVDGSAKFAAKDYEGALRAFRGARDIIRSPTTGINVALAEEGLGLLLEARESALEVKGLPVAPNEPAEHASARKTAGELADKLDKRIPSLVITIKGPSGSATLRVLVDGKAIPPSTVGLPRKVNPGTHAIVAAAVGYTNERRSVTVKEGASLAVEFTLSAAAGDPYEAPAEVEPPKDAERLKKAEAPAPATAVTLPVVRRVAEPPVLRRVHPGAYAGGVFLTVVGSLAHTPGIVFTGIAGAYDTPFVNAMAVGLMVGSLGLMGAGIPLIVYGNRRAPAKETALQAPTFMVVPIAGQDRAGLGLAGQF